MAERKNKTKIFGILLILGAVLLLAFGAGNASKVSDLKRIEKELHSEKLKLKKAKEEESKALNKLYKVNKELKRTKTSLTETKFRISKNKNRIVLLREELSEAERELEERGSLLSRRIREAHKSGGGLSLLELLFTSTSISDFLNRGYYLERIIAYDAELIRETREKAEAVAEAKRDLEKVLQSNRTLVVRIERKSREMQSQAETKRKIYKSLSKRRKEYERRVAELEKSSKLLEGLIQSRSGKTVGKAPIKATGRMIRPARGRIVSGFGYRRHPLWGGTHLHAGIDIGAAYGEPVRNADGGEVIFSGWWNGYGKAVVVDHGRGISTVYGHLSRIYVEAGQRIDKSQILGLIGSTGYSTGPHLHFEVRRGGKPVNPMAFLK
jgi:murein DD-endopeptidase MepM/ murein hydrolase activator NlpD